MEVYGEGLNTQNVSGIYNKDLVEHIDDLKELSSLLAEDAAEYRGKASDVKIENMKTMQEYVTTALQNLAYSLTLATQKIDDGLRLQMDDIDLLLKQAKEISVELDIKKEMRNRVTLGELTIIKRKPWRNIIKIVDHPLSDWKKPQLKYRRQALDFTLLDHVGVIGLRKEEADNNYRRGSIGSRASSLNPDETRQGLSTLKRGKLNRKLIATKTGPLEDRTIPEEEDNPTINQAEALTNDTGEEMVEKEDPVISRRRRPNVVLREEYKVASVIFHFLFIKILDSKCGKSPLVLVPILSPP